MINQGEIDIATDWCDSNNQNIPLFFFPSSFSHTSFNRLSTIYDSITSIDAFSTTGESCFCNYISFTNNIIDAESRSGCDSASHSLFQSWLI